MEVELIKNDYGFYKVPCPFCSYSAYDRPVTKTSPDRMRDLKRHITNEAKKEALSHYLANSGAAGKHLDYFSSHTKEQLDTPKIIKREYDQDLKLKQ